MIDLIVSAIIITFILMIILMLILFLSFCLVVGIDLSKEIIWRIESNYRKWVNKW